MWILILAMTLTGSDPVIQTGYYTSQDQCEEMGENYKSIWFATKGYKIGTVQYKCEKLPLNN